jgi:uncharacterized protein (UPF0335 family)
MTNNQLATIIQRIERLEDEKSTIGEDIKQVYSEAKGNGFDPKIIKKVIALRKMDAAKRLEEQALLATYMDALGMLADTPLGRAALRSAQIKTDEEDFA